MSVCNRTAGRYGTHHPGATAFTITRTTTRRAIRERASARYELTWDDDCRTLTIGARQGTFPEWSPGTPNIVIAGANNATIDPAPASSHQLRAGSLP
jgi:hypothetical protein